MHIFMDLSQDNENLSNFTAGQHITHVTPLHWDSYVIFPQHSQSP